MTYVACVPRRVLSVILACAIAATPMVGAAAPPQQPSGATFQAESNLVLVPVVVADRSGQHITGLQQSDFTIKDEGKEMKIASFEEVKQVPAKMRKPSTPGVFTNTIDSPSAAHGMTIIVLDQINTPFLDQAYARGELLKFLAQNVTTKEPTALMKFGRNGVRVVHDFTTDPAILIAALKRVSTRSDTLALTEATHAGLGPNDSELVNAEVNELDSFYNGTDGGYGAYQLTQAIEATLTALRHIAEGMEGIPGRKSLIWATGGFPFSLTSNGELASLRYYTTGATRSDMGGRTAGGILPSGALPPLPESTATTDDDLFAAIRPYFQRTMQALNRANIAIYPIDARGLVAYSSAATSRVRLNDVYGTEAQTHSTMNEIASVTGGKAYYNTNDITSAFSKATNESTQYYMIGYYAERITKPSWRKLKVAVTRPGAEVRARTGYMAGLVTTKKPAEMKNQDIRAALTSPMDYTALPFRVRWLGPPTAGASGKKKVGFEVVIEPNAATIDTANKNHIDLEFLVVVRDGKGEDRGHAGQKVTADLPAEALKVISAEGMNYSHTVELAPGSYQVRFIVRDNLSGKVGSVNAPLQVQ